MSQQALGESDHLKQTALIDIHRAHKAKLVPFAGYEMPIQYAAGIMAEHNHTRTAAGLFDVSHMGVVHVSGENATAALEKVIPSDLQELEPGQMKYAFLLNDQGGIIDDLLITRTNSGFLLVLNAGCKENDTAHLQEQIGSEVAITPNPTQAILALQGPKAAAVLKQHCPDATKLSFMTAGEFGLFGTKVWISRSGYTGEDGFELIIPNSTVEAIARKLLDHEEVQLIGLGARDSLRLEAGLCLYGHDLTTKTTPIEAALTWAVGKRRRTDGGFPGASVIQSQIENRPDTKRIGLLLEGRAIAREGAIVFSQDEHEVGKLTSGGFSPTLGRPVAMGYVARELSQPGTTLFVEVRNQRHPATVTKLPFVTHNYFQG